MLSMDVVKRTLSRQRHCKDGCSQLSRSFRHSLTESSPGRERDVANSFDAPCRKAAAWAWHHRAGGDAVPTRPSLEKFTTAAVRNSKIDRPKSRFRAEAITEKIYESGNKSKSVTETNIHDAAELSSLVKQITLFAKALQEQSSPDNSFSIRGGVDKLNQRSPTSDGLSKSCRFHQQKSEENKFGALPYRSVSNLSDPPRYHHTPGKLEVLERDYHDCYSTDDDMDDFKQTDLFIAKGVSSASFKMSFPLLQRLFRKIYKRNDYAITKRAHTHHYYHHHHHYYYYSSTPSEELQNLEEAKARRHSESFTVHTHSELADQETRRSRRHSGSDFADTCWGVTACEKTAEVSHQRSYEHSPDELLQPIPEHYSSNVRL